MTTDRPNEVEETAAPDLTAHADLLSSTAAFAGGAGELAAGVTETLRLESRLNVELMKSIAATRIAEIIGWSFAWALLLLLAGFSALQLTANMYIAFAVAGALQIAALVVLAHRRRKYRQCMGFERTRALLTGSEL